MILWRTDSQLAEAECWKEAALRSAPQDRCDQKDLDNLGESDRRFRSLSELRFHRKNHYVSCGYLKRWALSEKGLWVYRTLVSHPKVPIWKQTSVRGVAYHSHLYTRLVGGAESDDFERWLDSEFETPAQEVLAKATSDSRLTSNDWIRLIRFVAAQDVRTPARFLESLARWQRDVP